MKCFAGAILGGLACLALAACTSNPNLVVLMPDEAGQVGKIQVENQQGRQILDQAWSATRIPDASRAPERPRVLDENQVRALFHDALAAQPPAPARFLLYFKAGSDELTPDSEALLPEVLRVVRERRSVDASVIGHTDTQGGADFNYRLALRRAEAIAAQLIAAGLDPGMLEVSSHGETNPLIPTGDQVLEPRNRRVEVTVR